MTEPRTSTAERVDAEPRRESLAQSAERQVREGLEAVSRRAAGMDEIAVADAAILLGDPPSSYCSGPRCRSLLTEIAGGRLIPAADPHYVMAGPDRVKRRNRASVPVTRAALRQWLFGYGPQEWRQSAGADWCGFTTSKERA